MARWSLESRNPGKHWDQLEPMVARPLSPGEIQAKRLELCAELLELVLGEEPKLPAPVQRTLQGLSATLDRVQRQTRRLL